MPTDETWNKEREIVGTIGVPVARRHIFLCADQTTPKCCDKASGVAAWDFLKKRLKELGLVDQGGILRTKANCLRICEGGPIAVVYPEGAARPRAHHPGTSHRRPGRPRAPHHDPSPRAELTADIQRAIAPWISSYTAVCLPLSRPLSLNE